MRARRSTERVRELRAAAGDAVEERAREARRGIEESAARQNAQLDRLEREERNAERKTRPQQPASRPTARESLAEGDAVEIATLGGKVGTLVELRDRDAVVAVGVMKLTVPLRTLTKTSQQRAKPEIVVPMLGDVPDVHVSSEIDLRGMRIGEMDDYLLQSIDAAVRADLRSVRIIHGKGTGALRERVGELLRKDTRVKGFRLGLWNEGGAGVSVVDLE